MNTNAKERVVFLIRDLACIPNQLVNGHQSHAVFADMTWQLMLTGKAVAAVWMGAAASHEL